ncbi:MAG TPA: hypothetical protein VEX66_16435 [Microlunatus sp.]|jgi:hypothetical protein|nr:hypothetical protein [Microlunatus sp.]
MTEADKETSITAAGAEETAAAPAPADPDFDADLERETVEQELKGYPDQPTTS